MSDVRRLLATVERIHAVPRMDIFSTEVFQAIGELIPDVFISLDQLNVKTGEVNHLGNLDLPPDILAKVIELMPSHPVMPAAIAGLRGAIRVTDCVTQRQFRQTPHYKEYMKFLGVEYQTVVTLDVPGHIAGKRDAEIVSILSEKTPVSVRTINNHVRNILAKMNAETRTGACINALERLKRKFSDDD